MVDVIGGGMDINRMPLEQWFFEMPVCTRWWTVAAVAAGVLVQCHVVTPFQLFYSFRTVFYKSQYWRLLTTFFYFGPLSLDLLFHVFFIQRYSRLLEESSGRSPAHFSWLLFFSSSILLCMAPIFSMTFLGMALKSTLVYIWSGKNPDTVLGFFGLIEFRAPFLPWVLVLFDLVLYGQVPKDELCGIVVGHIWYFFNDVYPPLHNNSRPLDPPKWWVFLFEGPQQVEEPEEEEVAEDLPTEGMAAVAVNEEEVAEDLPTEGMAAAAVNEEHPHQE